MGPSRAIKYMLVVGRRWPGPRSRKGKSEPGTGLELVAPPRRHYHHHHHRQLSTPEHRQFTTAAITITVAIATAISISRFI